MAQVGDRARTSPDLRESGTRGKSVLSWEHVGAQELIFTANLEELTWGHHNIYIFFIVKPTGAVSVNSI